MVSAEEFYNPPAKYRIKPFWFWNGEITKEEIRYQIEEMADKGLGGIYICARQGMTVPYLSEEWLELVKYACEEAKRQGLEAWLYDEYPYPSGMSGGEVLLEHPEAEHKLLRHRTLLVKGESAVTENLGWGRILLARAFRQEEGGTDWSDYMDLKSFIGILQTEKIYQQTGLTKYNNKRFFSYGPQKVLSVSLPEGNWRIELYWEEAMGDFKYYGGFFDPCNREAVETFLHTTHERYEKAVGDSFGTSIFGMFSDEVGLLSPVPWSPLVPETFLKRNGYSLLECLPALHDDTVAGAFRIRYDYYETIHELFRENYHKQVSDWCKKHHLLYATEVPSMRHSTQRYSDVVGGDTAHEKLGKSLEWIYDEYIKNYRSNAKAVSSLARQLNKPYAMIESFHSLGWTMTLQDAKWMIDRLGSSGINLYNFHAFYYTIQDITKHDAPPSQFLQNPYWKYYRKLADYVGRMGVLVSNTKADIQIAVLDPVAALWTRLGNPFQGFSYQGESETEKAECESLLKQWVEVCKELLFHQLDYDHLDAELIEEARISEGRILLGQASYSVVVLPGCHCMEAGARRKLEEFVRQGGTLIGAGAIPYISIDKAESDAETKERWEALFSMNCTCRLKDVKKELAKICSSHIKPAAAFTVLEGNSHNIIAVTRVEEEEGREKPSAVFTFVANQGKGSVRVAVKTEGFSDPYAERLDLETGAIIPFQQETEGQKVLTLEAFESQWIRWKEKKAKKAEEKAGPLKTLLLPMAGMWKCRPIEKNICRFAEAELSLDGKTWRRTETKTFVEQCHDTGLLDSQNLRMEGMFGTPKKIRPAYPLTCYYRISFQAEKIPPKLELFMDRMTISSAWKMSVNGQEMNLENKKTVRINDQNNCCWDITSLVREGENQLVITCVVEKDEDGLKDPFYLRGEFGVASALDGRSLKLVRQPETICPDEYWPQGFPFYSGTMEYEKIDSAWQLPAMNHTEAFVIGLDWSHNRYECVEVLINGHSLGVKAYGPYKWECRQEFLKDTGNRVTVRVTNTLANMLDGTYFDYETHRLMPIKP